MPIVFIPREITPGETRVAAVPETVRRMVKDGFAVTVESGAGAASFISDAQYAEAGATVSADMKALWGAADAVLKLHPPRFNEQLAAHEAELIKEGAILASFLYPLQNADAVRTLARRKVTAFAMDQLPRISRAQKMDALSSQSNLAGYKAVILAAEKLPKILPLMMTPSGTIRPAKVVIMGAGVAGLQAIATARRLGAVVEVSDVRPAVKEQVESLGAKYIDVPTDAGMQDAGGYAREATPEFLARQQEAVGKKVMDADIVITTALVPGKAAPRLVTADMVRGMRRGSVIVDLAAEQGGNCELTAPGQVVVREGVTIVGTLNIPGTVPQHASEMYSKNLLFVLQQLFKNGERAIDFADEVHAGAIVTHAGAVVHPKFFNLSVSEGGK